MSDYYDRDELSRDGHIPSLISGIGAVGGCSCGWLEAPHPTMSAAVRAIREHIAEVDRTEADR